MFIADVDDLGENLLDWDKIKILFFLRIDQANLTHQLVL